MSLHLTQSFALHTFVSAPGGSTAARKRVHPKDTHYNTVYEAEAGGVRRGAEASELSSPWYGRVLLDLEWVSHA